MIRKLFYLSALAGSLCAQPLLRNWLPEEQSQTEAADSDYRQGRSALESGQWDRAIAAFSKSISAKSSSADAALYWKAYAQNRSGRKQDALSSIAELRRSYSRSRWLDDARALELEIKTQAGVPVDPRTEQNDDIKLMALNGLMSSEPKQALPILERILKTSNSQRLRERALFVLTQNPTPEARKILLDTARGSFAPELQRSAIRFIGMTGGEDARSQLLSLYQSLSDRALKKDVLNSLMTSGSRGQLAKLAQTEKDPELQRHAIRQLALAGGQDELWQLYKADGASSAQKQEILKSMFLGGNSEHLVDVVRSEQNPELRVAAIKSLGMMGSKGQGDLLVTTYRSDRNNDVREAIVNSLFIQQNASALVGLAKAETDPEWKRKIVSKLSMLHSKESTDYMMEILK